MAFEVQDGLNPTTTANAYITVEEFDEFMTDRNYTNTYTEVQKKAAIIIATEYLDIRFMYKDYKKLANQSTEHPRNQYYDKEGRLVTNGIHPAIFIATMEYTRIALMNDLVPNPTPDASGKVVIYEREKVDVLETEKRYGAGGATEMPTYPTADNRLIKAGLVVRGNDLIRG